MATTPFTVAREAALKESNQSGQLAVLKQWKDNPQFFCCISGNTVGVAKDPVPVLTIPERVVCIGADVTVDFGGSWSPTDSLAGTAYTIHWGDGSTTNGNFPNPRDAANENETYVGGYTAVGWYTITIDIQDTLGATASASIEVYARDCLLMPELVPWPAPPAARTRSAPMAACLGNSASGNGGVYYTNDIEASPVVWTASSDFLPATSGDQIDTAVLELRSDGSEWLYIIDEGRMFRCEMPLDSCTWEQPIGADDCAAFAGISPTACDVYTFGQLQVLVTRDGCQWISWDAHMGVTGYGEGTQYFGVAHTEDGWDTIAWSHIIYSIPDHGTDVQRIDAGGLAICQWDYGQTLFSACHKRDWSGDKDVRLYASFNGGLSWSLVDSFIPTGTPLWFYPAVYVPFSNTAGAVVYWTDAQILRRSTNGGYTFHTASAPGLDYARPRLVGPLTRDDLVDIFTNELWEWEQGRGLTHITPDMTVSGSDVLVLERDPHKRATKIFLVGYTNGTTAEMQINEAGGETDVKGNWPTGMCRCICKPELGEYMT